MVVLEEMMAGKTNPRSLTVAYYATTTPGTYVSVSAHYVSGMNFATYETWNGYKLSFNTVTLKKGTYFVSESFTLFSGKGLKVEPAPRFNFKRLKTIAEHAATLPDFDTVLKTVAAENGVTLTGATLTKAEAFESAPSE